VLSVSRRRREREDFGGVTTPVIRPILFTLFWWLFGLTGPHRLWLDLSLTSKVDGGKPRNISVSLLGKKSRPQLRKSPYHGNRRLLLSMLHEVHSQLFVLGIAGKTLDTRVAIFITCFMPATAAGIGSKLNLFVDIKRVDTLQFVIGAGRSNLEVVT
jgi:hypothetical protein